MKKIITRFPPSPSGYLHVGGARTALFNWLYARKMNGKFILRIEDTNTEKSSKESVDAILEALEWLGIDWDEGPYFQSQRLDVYKEYIQKLIDSGKAYYCTCSPQDLDEMRKKAMTMGGSLKYDNTCRDKGLPKTDGAVVRFKTPEIGTTVLEDIIKKNIVFQNSELDDFIIQRSDGSPIYNVAVVVDDITMGINVIIRGDDHISNTPKQILLYNAFDSVIPDFGHVPMVLGKDRTRLAKRHGAMSVTAYRDMGYLPDAVINYLVRLGWSYGDQEFFTREELIEKFTLKNIGHSAGVFDPDKLLALNAQHIQAGEINKIAESVLPFLKERELNANVDDYLQSVIKTLNKRSKTLIEMADGAIFYYKDDIVYDEKAAKKNLKLSSVEILTQLIDLLKNMEDFNQENLENVFKTLMEKTSLKLGKIAQPVRVALTGTNVSPGIFEVIEVIGKDKTIERITKAINFIKENS